MDVGLKLWVFLLGGVAILGIAWVLWSRFIGFPQHEPTVSPADEADETSAHRRDD
jgi:hypothetical protein